MLRYLADEDLDNRIVRGMRRAAPDIDLSASKMFAWGLTAMIWFWSTPPMPVASSLPTTCQL